MKTRVYFLDNLRTLLILLVVVLHAGMTYELGFDSFWIVSDPAKFSPIALVRMYLDLFIMYVMFFIAGYFVRPSLMNKTSVQFLKSKSKRILLPWILALATLIPAYKFIFLYSRGLPQEEWYSYFHFFERTGSDLGFFSNNLSMSWLWFLPVLYMFQLVYLGLYKTGVLKLKISVKSAVILTFIIGVVYGMIISLAGLKGWQHTLFFDFQTERLLVYFMVFLMGALCNKRNVFDSNKKNYKLYIWANVGLTIGLGVFTAVALNFFYNMTTPERNFFFISDMADRVFYYAAGIISMLSFLYVLIHAFRFNLNYTNNVLNEFSRNSYSVYINHMIVLGVIALAMYNLPIPGLVKYILLSILTFMVSNMLVFVWRNLKEKRFNFKTVFTAVFILVIFVTAFTIQPNVSRPNNNIQESITTEAIQEVTSIHAAVVSGNTEALKKHIEAGTNLNLKEPAGGSSPLISACVFNQTEIALMLIEAGADINQTNNEGSTALHTAAFFCRTEIVKSLLENGANTTIKNKAGSTAKESVLAPFTLVKGIYEYFQKIYEPLGLKLDLERIEKTRPLIAEIIN